MGGVLSSLLSLLAALLIAGCASTASFESAPVKQVSERRPIHVEGGSRPIELGKLLARLPRGEAIGAVQTGRSCVPRGPLSWNRGRESSLSEDFGNLFSEELSAAGYTVVGDPNVLFEDSSGWKAEFVIAGVVRDLRANVCYAKTAGPTSRGTGEASMAVEWQIYSHRTKKVELTMTAEGGGRLARAQESAAAEAISRAFLAAFRNLLADSRFHDLVAAKDQRGPKLEPARDPILVEYQTARSDAEPSVETMVSEARMGVVTIFVGNAMGSGFLISRDGYLLTNQHVVGKARYVKARFVTGREVNGEVVRVDQSRDVALIKLESDLYRYLPLGESSAVQPGSEVFAIGTPLDGKLGQSVTKGVVSGYGEEEGLRILRSDVSVHQGNSGGPLLDRSGNVVGMSVSGFLLMPAGVGVGLNSFIPIEEALEALGILQSAGSS